MPPKDKNVCFSGYRPFKMPKGGDENSLEIKQVKQDLLNMILKMIKLGKTSFINGLGMGFDIIAAEQVVKIKMLCPYVKLITVAPFSAKYHAQWPNEWKERTNGVCKLSDEALSLSDHYNRGITTNEIDLW